MALIWLLIGIGNILQEKLRFSRLLPSGTFSPDRQTSGRPLALCSLVSVGCWDGGVSQEKTFLRRVCFSELRLAAVRRAHGRGDPLCLAAGQGARIGFQTRTNYWFKDVVAGSFFSGPEVGYSDP